MFARASRCWIVAGLLVLVCLSANGQEPNSEPRALRVLVERLASNDPEERAAAALGLRMLKVKASAAIPALLRALQDKDQRVRINAVAALGLTGSDTPEVLDALTNALEFPGGLVKETAITALVHLGKKSVSRLYEKLNHPDALVRVTAAYGLWRLREPVPRVTPIFRAGLKDGNASLRAVSAYFLGKLQAKEAVPDLIPLLKDREQAVVNSTIGTFCELGPLATAAAPALCEFLGGLSKERLTLQWDVRATLIALGPGCRPAVVKLLQHAHAEMRVLAAGILVELDADSREVLPLLRRELRDPDPLVQMAAAEALAKMGPRGQEALPELVANLGNKFGGVQRAALKGLAALGSGAREALPALKQALITIDSAQGTPILAQILANLGEPGMTTLRSLLQDKEPRRRCTAAVALAQIEGTWKNYLPILIEALEGGQDDMRLLMFLEQAGPVVRDAVPAVIKLLKKGTWVRVQAARTLGKIAAGNQEAVQALHPYLQDPEAYVRNHAALALWLIAKNARDTVPVLVGVFEDPEVGRLVREDAARFLGQMGTQAEAALPALLRALNQPSRLRSVAAEVLQKIDPELARVGVW